MAVASVHGDDVPEVVLSVQSAPDHGAFGPRCVAQQLEGQGKRLAVRGALHQGGVGPGGRDKGAALLRRGAVPAMRQP